MPVAGRKSHLATASARIKHSRSFGGASPPELDKASLGESSGSALRICPVFGQLELASQLLRNGMAHNKPSTPTVEISQSLGEWVVTIVGAGGNTYSRIFDRQPDAVAFAEDQRLRLGLQVSTPRLAPSQSPPDIGPVGGDE